MNCSLSDCTILYKKAFYIISGIYWGYYKKDKSIDYFFSFFALQLNEPLIRTPIWFTSTKQLRKDQIGVEIQRWWVCGSGSVWV